MFRLNFGYSWVCLSQEIALTREQMSESSTDSVVQRWWRWQNHQKDTQHKHLSVPLRRVVLRAPCNENAQQQAKYYLCLIRYIKMCWLALQSDAIIYDRHEYGISKGNYFEFFFSTVFLLFVRLLLLLLMFLQNEMKKKDCCLFFSTQLPKMFVSSIINFIENERNKFESTSRKLTLKIQNVCVFVLVLFSLFQCFRHEAVGSFFLFLCVACVHLYRWTIYLT